MALHLPDPAGAPPDDFGPSPRTFLVAGAALAAGAIALSYVPDERLFPARVVAILASLALALRGVTLRFAAAGTGLDEQAVTAVYLAGGAFVALANAISCHPDWDSFRLLLGVMVAVGLIGAVLVLMPRAARRTAVVLLAGTHFVGILTAVFSVAPPNAPACWLANTMWTAFYRPYLQFTYLNNAYHFYSPEPGPPTLLWFRVEYEKGDPVWVKLPNREDFRTRLEYQRRLALTEATNVNADPPDPGTFELLLHKRHPDRLVKHRVAVPLHPRVSPAVQFRTPARYSQVMIAAFSRHVATSPKYVSPTHPDAAVTAVKVYRVVHNIIQPRDLAAGLSPLDETLYTPFYMGEFHWGEKRDAVSGRVAADADTAQPAREWQMKDPNDPLLYWMIPIVKVPKLKPGEVYDPNKDDQYEYVVEDWLAVHAGDRRP